MRQMHWPPSERDIVNAYLIGFLLFFTVLGGAFILVLWRAHGLWWLCLIVAMHLSLVGYAFIRGYQQVRELISSPRP
ncbi:hypothetical protein KJ611_00145 [Patescibacteria group bacterium]|nr:hypothetical protein [Patescibacteria group bacterium]MBU1705651.1 hypothetical protein [Patescibacteria group bacterium]